MIVAMGLAAAASPARRTRAGTWANQGGDQSEAEQGTKDFIDFPWCGVRGWGRFAGHPGHAEGNVRFPARPPVFRRVGRSSTRSGGQVWLEPVCPGCGMPGGVGYLACLPGSDAWPSKEVRSPGGRSG